MSQLIRTPFKVGHITLQNRLVFVPFETNYATPDSFPTDRHLDFYRRAAAGGVGLIVMEAVNVNPEIIATKYGMGIAHDKYIPHLRRLTDAIHREGGVVILQIADKSLLLPGRSPADMSQEEIAKMERYFVDAIERTYKAGFDGMEFHGCHLYTLGDFLSREGNKRRDEYGGGINNRVRIIEEICQAAKAKVGPNFIFACRYNGDDFLVGGNTVKDAAAIGQRLEKLGFDLLDISAGGRIEPFLKQGKWGGWKDSYSADRCIPDAHYADAANIHLAEGIKKAVKRIPVIGCGKIGTVQLAEQLLQEGKVDLVGMGRPIFCDPELPRKAFASRDDDIVKCNWCKVCHRLYVADEPVVCPKWPGVKVKV